MAFKKAVIKIYKDMKKGLDETFTVHFNPSEYSLDFSASYTQRSVFGAADPITQFVSGQSHSLTMSLYFDTFTDFAQDNKFKKSGSIQVGNNPYAADKDKEDVRKYTNKLIKLVQIKGSMHTPPVCEFSWGSLHFYGYVESIKQQFTMFTSDGKPVRAKVDLTFKSLESLDKRLKEPPESPDRTKQRVIGMDTQIWALAYEEYDDPAKWRVIAKENNIRNPRDVYPGMVLKLPSI